MTATRSSQVKGLLPESQNTNSFSMKLLRQTVFVLVLASYRVALCEDTPLFQFGAIADCQYCDSNSERRKYDQSPQKLEECIDDFNQQELTHIVHLGDFIDKDWKSFDVVIPITEKANAPFKHVLGNHDFDVADKYKTLVPGRLGLTDRYYDFAIDGWRFLILDTNDISLYAYPKDSKQHQESILIYEELGGDLPKYNGGIGKEQLEWIESKLEAAEKAGEKVILHGHHPVYPVESHAAWNAREVVALLERYNCVAAYINGHRHDGSYGFKKGIHYLTLKGMVDTNETAYATIEIYPNRIRVNGTGRQDDYVLEVPLRNE